MPKSHAKHAANTIVPQQHIITHTFNRVTTTATRETSKRRKRLGTLKNQALPSRPVPFRTHAYIKANRTNCNTCVHSKFEQHSPRPRTAGHETHLNNRNTHIAPSIQHPLCRTRSAHKRTRPATSHQNHMHRTRPATFQLWRMQSAGHLTRTHQQANAQQIARKCKADSRGACNSQMQEDTRHSERKLDQQNINHKNTHTPTNCRQQRTARTDLTSGMIRAGLGAQGCKKSHARLAANTNATQKNIIQTLIQQTGNNHKHTLQWISAVCSKSGDVPS